MFEAIVVEGTPGAKYPGARVTLPQPKPFNYNAALNAGAAVARGEWLVFCNNDLRFHSKWWTNLHASAGTVWSPRCPAWPKQRAFSKGTHYGDAIGETFSGWCFAMHRSDYEKIVKLNECVEFWCSDNEAVHQFREVGLRCALVGESHVQHLHSATLKTQSPARHRELTTGQVDKWNALRGQNLFGRRGEQPVKVCSVADVTVAICTFGEARWRELAKYRALPTAAEQAPARLWHGGTLAEARNAALADIKTDFIVYLDADDEIEPGYIRELLAGTADIRAPAVRYVSDGTVGEAHIPLINGNQVPTMDVGCILRGNWIVVGALARAQTLRDAGGWREWPMYEDWDLWMRCLLKGATVEARPSAVYRAHVSPGSRNAATPEVRQATRAAILHRNMGEAR